MYYIIRGKYKKSPVIYNFSLRKASNKTGVSISTLRNYIPLMIKLNLAYYHKGNLQLVGHNKLEKRINGTIVKHKCTIDTTGKNITKVSVMKKLLLLKIVECKARQIQHVNSSLKNEISNRFNEVNKNNRDEIKGEYVSMSVTLIANELEVSRSYAHSLINWWEDNKYIDKINGRKKAASIDKGLKETLRIPGIARKSITDIMRHKFGYGYWWKNLYITVEPSFFAFLTFPLKPRVAKYCT